MASAFGSGVEQYPSLKEIRASVDDDTTAPVSIQRLTESLVNYNGKVMEGVASAPMACDELIVSLDFWYGVDCSVENVINDVTWEAGSRSCLSSKRDQELTLEQNYEISCASASATPSTSIAPEFFDESGCGCLDNTEVFNTLVFSNYDASSDVQGRLAVGGNASISAFSVGDKLDESYGKEDHLIVKGHMTFITGRVFGGNIVYGDESSEISDAIIHGLLRHNKIVYNPERVDFDYYQEYYQTLSTKLCTLNDTGDIFIEAGNGAAISTRGNQMVEVLTMTCDEMDKLTSIDFGGVSGKETIIINMRGDTCQFLIEQIVPNPEYVLWNFCDATRVGIESVGVQGSILAPFADAVSNSGVVYGQSVAMNWEGHAQQNNVECMACLPFSVAGILHPSASVTPSASPSSSPSSSPSVVGEAEGAEF